MIDLDIDELERLCKYEIGRGTANPYTVNENPINAMLEIITLLRQAEKDAARYRWLRDESAFTHENAPLTFFADTNGDQIAFHFNGSSYSVLHDEMLDAAIDEAMQCK
jgi:hypothetical protein